MLHLEGLVLVFPGPEGSLRNKLVCLTHYSDSSEETDTGTLLTASPIRHRGFGCSGRSTAGAGTQITTSQSAPPFPHPLLETVTFRAAGGGNPLLLKLLVSDEGAVRKLPVPGPICETS